MSMHRILWLLNHTTLRQFELEQLNSMGITEVFTPKNFPSDESNLSVDVDRTLDARLTIPTDDLKVLNEQDWYSAPTTQAWEIANHHFDVAIIGFFPEQLKSVVRHFEGAIILRAFGLSEGYSYSQLIYQLGGERLVRDIKSLGKRFWFGMCYQHLSQGESQYLRERSCFLPIGLATRNIAEDWTGTDQRLLFFCPRIGSSPYFRKVYTDFVQSFGHFPHTIGGAQPIEVKHPNVIGFVSREHHEKNMREHRVMFYHSQERNQVHYHPFEAIAVGMPLVFMGGGLLDTLGGRNLPGRCKSVDEASRKIKLVLSGDKELIDSIRSTQNILLNAIRAKNCTPAWEMSYRHVLDALGRVRASAALHPVSTQKKVAVILPITYKGGSLRGAKMIAAAIQHGSQDAGEPTEVVLAHLDDEDYLDNHFEDVPPQIKCRPFKVRQITATEASRAMHYAGYEDWKPTAKYYLVLDDGMKQFVDCDLWLVISDGLYAPLLPLRPVIHMVYDYIQRYLPVLPGDAEQIFINFVRTAERVLVTTNFTYRNALQYGGISAKNLVKVPMLSPRFTKKSPGCSVLQPDYFIWTTNAAPHKNHAKALKALDIYYKEFAGTLRCVITGVSTDSLLTSSLPHLKKVMADLKTNKNLLGRLTFAGKLPDQDYQHLLSGAAFLWHPARIDNGTFSVVEAASVGVPALSSDYPAMREINDQFQLNLNWSDADDPRSMGLALREMEYKHIALRKKLPTAEELDSQDVRRLAGAYWKAVRECL